MGHMICWVCQTELSYKEYDGTEFLGDDGTKPCFDCLQDMLEENDDPANQEE